MPVLMVVCCAWEGVKVPPLELTIEDVGVLAQTHSRRDASRPQVTKEYLSRWYGHRLRAQNDTEGESENENGGDERWWLRAQELYWLSGC